MGSESEFQRLEGEMVDHQCVHTGCILVSECLITGVKYRRKMLDVLDVVEGIQARRLQP